MVIQGVIKPPPEIRAVADRTALYVSRNGRDFERKILHSNKGKQPKFAFLHTTNPFYAYYQQRVVFYEQGGTDNDNTDNDSEKKKKKEEEEEEALPTKEIPAKAVTAAQRQRTSAVDPVARSLLKQQQRIANHRKEAQKEAKRNQSSDANPETSTFNLLPPPPPPLHFVNIVAPSSLSVLQMEIMQVVAQYTAMDGAFLSQLTLKEWNNPTFGFCQPRHGHFCYFSALVDAYRRVCQTWTTTNNNSNNDDDAVSKMATSLTECLDQAAYRAAYRQARTKEQLQNNQQEEPVNNIDWHDFVVVETIDFPKDEQVDNLLPPPAQASLVQPAQESSLLAATLNDDQVRVVSSYQPRLQSSTAKPVTMVDPISKQSVAVQDMPEHLRIQLLDPKWAQERQKFQEGQRDSNLVSGDAVAANLARLNNNSSSNNNNDSNTNKRSNRPDDEPSKLGPSLPVAKRPRVQAAPVVNLPAAPVVPPGTTMTTEAVPPPPPPPPVPENPFATAGTQPTANTNELLPADAFIASLASPNVTLQVTIPNDAAHMAYNFYGQIVPLQMQVTATMKQVKQELSKTHLNDMPLNKIQFKNTATGAFLSKDAQTLASYNIGPTARLELKLKSRGGRK